MTSQYMNEVKSQNMEQTMSEALDGTRNTSSHNPNGDLNNISDSHSTSTNGDELGSYHLDKKTRITHAPISSSEASSNNTNSADSNTMDNNIYPSDLEATRVLQSLQSSMCAEEGSVGHQATSSMLDGISEYGTFDDESPNPPASAAFHAGYRKSSSDLMTLHMFTGRMNGNKAIYVPVYKRNDSGKLLKLLKSWSGHWEYAEPGEWTEEEVEGLKIVEEPKAEVVLQSSKPKKAVGRRTLADFGLPETEKTGGWGWL